MAHLLTISDSYDTGPFEGFGHCGGSIITKNVILTAGHCVMNKSAVVILVGHSNLSSENLNVFPVETILIHPNCTVQKNYIADDIALLKLFDNMEFNKSIKPIALPKRQELQSFEKVWKDIQYSNFVVAGWGKTVDFTHETKWSIISKFH